MRQSTDQEVLRAARSGNREAIERLLERHEAHIYRFGMRMCRDAEDAKDVLQETMIAAVRGLPDFRGDAASLTSWLWAIARTECAKKRRKGRHRADRGAPLGPEGEAAARTAEDPAGPPDEEAAARRMERALTGAIESLEPMYREAILLRDVEGLTAREAAKAVGIRVHALRSRLHRARVAVRAKLAPLIAPDTTEAPLEEDAPCPEVIRAFSKHLEGDLRPEVCAEMERHIEDCRYCRAACRSLKATLALCRDSKTPEVPAQTREAVRRRLASLVRTSG